MTTQTASRQRTASTVTPTVAEDRWSRILRILGPGMATVAMWAGAAPFNRTVWTYLLTERSGAQHPLDESGPNRRSPR